jgi:rhodanese-related sulfurtransferase
MRKRMLRVDDHRSTMKRIPPGRPGERVHIVLIALSALVVFASSACSPITRTSDRDVVFLSSRDVVSLIGTGVGQPPEGAADVILIDARAERHFNAGHIPGAVSLLLGESLVDHPRLSRKKRIIVYGEHSNDARAKAMSKKLIENGYDRTVMFDEGVQGWVELGYPLVTIDQPSN